MNTNHQMYKNQKLNSGKNGFIKHKIPIIEIPKDADIFNCFIFNEEIKSIEIYFINNDSTILGKYKIGNFPLEKCKNCRNDLTIDDLYFLIKDANIELYCSKCGKENNSITKFHFPAASSPRNNKIINSLNSFLEKNKSPLTQEYTKIMEAIIDFTNIIILLIDQFQSNKVFQSYILFYQSYIDNLALYLEIINNLKMDNLYLFIRNFLVASTDKIDEQFLYGYFNFYFENINNFNASDLHLQILKNIFKISQQHTNILFQTVELKIEQKKKILIQDFNDINYDYFSLKNEINERKIIWLRKKIKIVERIRSALRSRPEFKAVGRIHLNLRRALHLTGACAPAADVQLGCRINADGIDVFRARILQLVDSADSDLGTIVKRHLELPAFEVRRRHGAILHHFSVKRRWRIRGIAQRIRNLVLRPLP